MKRTLHLGCLSLSFVLAACNASVSHQPPRTEGPDLAQAVMFSDDGGPDGIDMTMSSGEPDVCGDPGSDPSCTDVAFGPPNATFPLQSDPMKNPNEKDSGVNRDNMGWLGLDSTHTAFNYLWIANASDLNNAGTVSKLDSKTVREIGRYLTVTCSSLKTGNAMQCDGMNGCCAIDDWARYQARKAKMAQPPHQTVQLTDNYPSRTSVDFNGDLFISNRAFGGQSSVTKIANDTTACIDRNHDGKIETSSDTSGNGFIEEDCNGDGQPDDIAAVKKQPCSNGLKQEFYGLDDECILWTSNTFGNDAVGRPLGLAAGANDSNISDPWAGSYALGAFVRIDGSSGLDKDDTQLPPECHQNSGPYGLAVDAAGIGWTPELGGGKLCFFDTKNSKLVGSVRDPQWGQMEGYGVTLDRDQNVWVGMGVERYTPDRTNGFKNLGMGWWAQIQGANGIGIAADSRNNNAYFVWSCNGQNVLQIPASTIKMLKVDQQINPAGWPTIDMPCYGVGVDADQNVWGVDMQTTTRALVDNKGNITQPSVNGQPKGNNKCPAGDSCENAGAYTYSDFTGFGLRNFTRPQGSYSMVVSGCADSGAPVDTQWFAVTWDADVPPNTSLTVHARSGNSPNLTDPSWTTAMWSTDATQSPLLLQNNLVPNLMSDHPNDVVKDAFIQVEFIFKTQTQSASPKLKSFHVGFKCNKIG